jgi:hypothetical protein
MSIAFITLTNSGYVDFTLNCLKSLEKCGCKHELIVYCIGKEGCDILRSRGYKPILIDEEKNSNFQTFRVGNWSNIVYNKFVIIHENLLKYDFVCFTDSDIVYSRHDFIKYIMGSMPDKEMLIQNESIENTNKSLLCSGFMFIRSTKNTISLFDPANVEEFRNKVGWGDQIYINNLQKKLVYDVLPLELFPNGRYYYKHHLTIPPYLIHFNWIFGDEKKEKMKEYRKWFLPNVPAKQK